MNNPFTKIVDTVSRKVEAVSWVALLLMMVIVAANTITRRFNYPIYGTYDFSCFLLVLVTAPALSRCAVEKGHISLDMLTSKMPEKAQTILGCIINALCAIFCVIITYSLAIRGIAFFKSGMTGMTVNIPVWPFILVEALMTLLLALVYVSNMIQSIAKLKGGNAE